MKRITLELIVILLILLFGYAAMNKLLDYERFVSQIGRSPILKGMSSWLAWIIPAVELITCLLLIVPKWRLKGLYTSFILMLCFTFYIAAILTFSEKVPCSCGGVLNQLGWKSHLIFNIIFTGLALTGIIIERRLKGGENDNNKLQYT